MRPPRPFRKPVRPTEPTPADSAWNTNPIDRFLGAEHAKHKLAPVSETRSVQLTVNATRYVNLISPTPAFPYDSWTIAATNIQDAVDVALAGELILVTNGVYQAGARVVNGMSNRVVVTKPVTVQSVNGPEVTSIAGYQVPGTTNGAAAVRCVYLTNGALLSGFTLTNGATQTSGDLFMNRSGGGVWCVSVSAVVSNSVIYGNSANVYAGGAYSGTLNHCTLSSNSASQGGGTYQSTLKHCTLTGNLAERGGGAYGSTLNNSLLTGNSAN